MHCRNLYTPTPDYIIIKDQDYQKIKVQKNAGATLANLRLLKLSLFKGKQHAYKLIDK